MNTVEPKVYLIGRPSVVWEDGDVPALRDFMADHDLTSVHSEDAMPGEIIPEIGGRIDYWSFDPEKRRPGGAHAYFARLLAEGHTNVIELAHWNFIIRCSQGVAREILRYRTAERSQASTRYIDYADVPLVSVPCDAGDQRLEADARFDISWRQAYREAYRHYTELGAGRGLAGTALRKWARSHAARFVPFSAATWLMLALNAQTARHLILQRANQNAHPEFRDIAVQLFQIVGREAPNVFQDMEAFSDVDGGISVGAIMRWPPGEKLSMCSLPNGR
jgi:flavin-dependent thymidylate synthase